jgi:tetratricopeptide (TPR) repeat protein
MFLQEETVKLLKANLGRDHPYTLNGMNDLAAMYWSSGRLDKSMPLFEEVLRLQKAKSGAEHPVTLNTMANLGVSYKDAGRPGEALPLLEEAARASRKHASLRWVNRQLVEAYFQTHQPDKAVALANALVAEARATLPAGSPELALALAQTG